MLFRFCIVLTSCFALFGCSNQTTLRDALEDYHERLSRVLGVEIPTTSLTVNIDLPSRAELVEQAPAVSINVREFLNLPNCQLTTLIAQRNTGLGKTQLPSQRYLYERALITALEDCIDVTSDNTIKAKLESVLTEKTAYLPSAYRNLIQVSDEIRLSFAQSSSFIEGDGSDGFNQTRSALSLLIEAAPEKDTVITSNDLEQALKQLNDFRLPVRQWRSQQLITQQFSKSNTILAHQLPSIACQSVSGKEKATILRNVFMMFFADIIQPIASQMNYYHYQMAPLILELTSHNDVNPMWYRVIKTNTIESHDEYRQAMAEHIGIWQDFFKRCGLSPVRA